MFRRSSSAIFSELKESWLNCAHAIRFLHLTTHRRNPLPTDWQHTDGIHSLPTDNTQTVIYSLPTDNTQTVIHSLPTDNTQTVSTPYRLTTHWRYPLPTDWQHTDGIHSLPTDNIQTVIHSVPIDNTQTVSTPYLHLFGTYDVAHTQFNQDHLGSLKMALLQRRNMYDQDWCSKYMAYFENAFLWFSFIIIQSKWFSIHSSNNLPRVPHALHKNADKPTWWTHSCHQHSLSSAAHILV
jgi:hypothetical protein